jgi:nucleoside-diphosphate-sugar epimerase
MRESMKVLVTGGAGFIGSKKVYFEGMRRLNCIWNMRTLRSSSRAEAPIVTIVEVDVSGSTRSLRA